MNWIYCEHTDYRPIKHQPHLVFTSKGQIVLALPYYNESQTTKDYFYLIWVDVENGNEIELVSHCMKIISPSEEHMLRKAEKYMGRNPLNKNNNGDDQ